MKAIMVMFDSLNRRMLSTYGCEWTHTPNFTRLQNHTAVFDNSFVGSMPCMPARRELHTGRYNFLHRAWGPLEPFDDSMPQILKEHGIYTHLVTDHYHYWEDGGATYHSRYSSWESVRGQEGDPWKGLVGGPDIPEKRIGRSIFYTPHYYVNKKYLSHGKPCAVQTFDLGLEFLETNWEKDQWFLQIEAFDPHEPFFSPDEYQKLYPHEYSGPEFDWPDYKQVTESPEEIDHVRRLYAASLSMCDEQLGRVLDFMDANHMWEDTMLIVCTDHGFLLGEHSWWAKNRAPYFNEVAHTPLYIWDPRYGVKGERRKSVVQMIDFAPTLLNYFGAPIPEDMTGKPLDQVITEDRPVRETALYGLHGAHICCTDGEYVYMRAPVSKENQPVYSYTLMPTSNASIMTERAITTAELVGPLSFTKGMTGMKMNFFGRPKNIGIGIESYQQGTMLYDQIHDIHQLNRLEDAQIENRMIKKLVKAMQENDAPEEQYERLGLQEYVEQIRSGDDE